MNFALVVPSEFAEHYRQHKWEISGLLNWAKVLNGDLLQINEFAGGYDWVMLNISSTEPEYISVVKQIDPDAKIVTVFDYGFDVVSDFFGDLTRIKQLMSRADAIFSVNRNQVAWMQTLLPDKIIHYCPHPADIENMMKFRKKKEERTMGVASMWHQYQPNTVQQLEVLKAVERKLRHPIQKTLIGLKSRLMREQGIPVLSSSFPMIADDYPDEKVRGQPLDPELYKIWQRTPPGVSWDGVLPYMGVEPWYHFLSQFSVCLDMYTVNSIGRFGIDCAGVGIPLVASNKQDSSKLLYPFTTVDPYAPEGAVTFLAKLLANDDFYEKVQRVAEKNLPHYGFAKSKERMMRILESM